MFLSTPFAEPFLQYLRIRRIKKYVPKRASLLDVGCGDGQLLFALSNHLSRGEGLDQRVDLQARGNIHLQQWQDSTSLPFLSQTFDIVTMTAVLEHLDNPEFVVRECHRVLKSGGRFLLTTPAPRAKPLLEFLAFRLGVVSPQEIAGHKHYFSKDELKQLLITAGFTESAIHIELFQLGFNIFATAVK